MMSAFFKLSYRDQILLLCATFILFLSVFWFLILTPISDKRDEMSRRNELSRASLSRVDEMVSELRRLNVTQSSASQRGSSTAGINASALRYGLKISRLTPNSLGEIELRLENVKFSELIRWINYVESELGFTTIEAGFSVPSGKMKVNATLRFGGG